MKTDIGGYEQEEGKLFLMEEKWDKPFKTIEEAIDFAERAEALEDEQFEQFVGLFIGIDE